MGFAIIQKTSLALFQWGKEGFDAGSHVVAMEREDLLRRGAGHSGGFERIRGHDSAADRTMASKVFGIVNSEVNRFPAPGHVESPLGLAGICLSEAPVRHSTACHTISQLSQRSVPGQTVR